jgi:hypothetical protein
VYEQHDWISTVHTGNADAAAKHSSADIAPPDKGTTEVAITTKTVFPFANNVNITVGWTAPAVSEVAYTLHLRVPSWLGMHGLTIKVNGLCFSFSTHCRYRGWYCTAALLLSTLNVACWRFHVIALGVPFHTTRRSMPHHSACNDISLGVQCHTTRRSMTDHSAFNATPLGVQCHTTRRSMTYHSACNDISLGVQCTTRRSMPYHSAVDCLTHTLR